MQRQENLTYAMVATPLHMRVERTPLPTTVRRSHDAHQLVRLVEEQKIKKGTKAKRLEPHSTGRKKERDCS